MTVDWSHYTDATPTCRKIEADRRGVDPSTVEIEDNCLRVDGNHCYVLTSDRTEDARFGELVRNCFDIRDDQVARER
jgi:hypothetical protein